MVENNDKFHDHEIYDPCHDTIRGMQKLGGLRMWIMHVLDENGLTNGAEIMEAVQAHTVSPNGPYKNAGPLPGSVYPMLKKMVAEDIIVKNSKGQYDLTENGRKLNSKLLGRFKEDNHEENIRKVWSIKNILAEMENDVSYLEDIKTEKLNAEKERITRLKERLNEIYETLE